MIVNVSAETFRGTDPRLDRAHGRLLGQLAGDSLGSPGEIRRLYPDGVRDLVDGGPWNIVAGQPTDDSEMALALARTLVGNVRGSQRTSRRARISASSWRIALNCRSFAFSLGRITHDTSVAVSVPTRAAPTVISPKPIARPSGVTGKGSVCWPVMTVKKDHHRAAGPEPMSPPAPRSR